MAGKGLFIVLEGIDGSGKDTHIKFLAKELRELGYAVVETAEPSRDRVGTFLKRYAKRKEKRLPAESEALLYASDRFDHVKNVIKPPVFACLFNPHDIAWFLDHANHRTLPLRVRTDCAGINLGDRSALRAVPHGVLHLHQGIDKTGHLFTGDLEKIESYSLSCPSADGRHLRKLLDEPLDFL